MDFSLKDIDEVINIYKKKVNKGKNLEIIKAIRNQYLQDRDLGKGSLIGNDPVKFEHFLTNLYGDVLPIKAKEHYLTSVYEINKKLEEFYFKGLNPCAIGINPEQCTFEKLHLDPKKEKQFEKEKDYEKLDNIVNELNTLRRQFNQNENKRLIIEDKLEKITKEIYSLREYINRVKNENDQRLRYIEAEIGNIKNDLSYYKTLLEFSQKLDKWLNNIFVYRLAKKIL